MRHTWGHKKQIIENFTFKGLWCNIDTTVNLNFNFNLHINYYYFYYNYNYCYIQMGHSKPLLYFSVTWDLWSSKPIKQLRFYCCGHSQRTKKNRNKPNCGSKSTNHNWPATAKNVTIYFERVHMRSHLEFFQKNAFLRRF